MQTSLFLQKLKLVSYSCLKQLISRDACGIADTRDEYFYITGNTTGTIGDLWNQVAKFGPNGFIKSLPDLKTGRTRHACAGYYNAQDHFVLLVVGGKSISSGEITGLLVLFGNNDFLILAAWLSSTEIFEIGVSSQWREASPLPNGLFDAAAVTLNNKVYLTGRYAIKLQKKFNC